ncbi:hypothetical protein SAMN06269185_2852 [Natronoarchaeum philippinense]|uniref:Uncharacterized protein n=1 Tax=Natronoarchaeum philippinense TaxID=558529 RepID=A0A285P5I4_NATPI|nr:glucoamylase family protein [Natronoarchaeum philippinense]SNZ17019.1 hypothetical protein SAMN06269185_2852 [Natronoarchaeum philippinense]
MRTVVSDAYRFFETFETDAGLIPDNVVLDDGDVVDIDTRTSPSNVAMDMLSTVAAAELDIIENSTARDRLRTTLSTLEGVEKWNGLFYRWYDAEDGSLAVHESARHISTVDNGHLTAAFAVVAQAFPDLHDAARSLLEAEDYSGFLADDGTMLGAYYFDRDGDGPGFSEWAYDQINSEPRVASYVAIGKGDFPESHWWQPRRTALPDESEYQQRPDGEWRSYDGVEVFEGCYEYAGNRAVPTWGGAMFEALMPSLFIKEKELSPGAWAPNNYNHVQAHRAFAAENDWPVWGLSSCGLPDGYGTFGVPQLGEWDGRYEGGPWVTPHAVGLAAMYDPEAAAEALDSLVELGVDGPYGLYDSVNAETGEVTEKYYSLDQGMLLSGLANALTDGALREYFHADPVGSRPEHLLEREQFSL